MTDRELLELAAKAAGIMLEWDGHPAEWQPMYYEGKTYHSFNPLTDDGDALRLAVQLKLEVFCGMGMKGDIVTVLAPQEFDLESVYERHEQDACAATRRAIVRAAAEIGKQK